MRHLSIFLLLFIFSLVSFAQGTIISLSVVPENPTVNDLVEVHAELMFTSSSCDIDNQLHSLNGFNIGASAHHCIGMLTAICDATDVFELGQLAAGRYTFDLVLTSGAGEPGCTAGIVADDNHQFSFIVSGSVGIDEPLTQEILFYPTPTKDVLNLGHELTESSEIINSTGQLVMTLPIGTRQVDISTLEAGVYVLKSTRGSHKIVKI